jgi:hypothetical protein
MFRLVEYFLRLCREVVLIVFLGVLYRALEVGLRLEFSPSSSWYGAVFLQMLPQHPVATSISIPHDVTDVKQTRPLASRTRPQISLSLSRPTDVAYEH